MPIGSILPICRNTQDKLNLKNLSEGEMYFTTYAVILNGHFKGNKESQLVLANSMEQTSGSQPRTKLRAPLILIIVYCHGIALSLTILKLGLHCRFLSIDSKSHQLLGWENNLCAVLAG